MCATRNEATGRVVRAESGRFLVATSRALVPCGLRGRIKKEKLGRKRNVVVGDEVRILLIGPLAEPGREGVIEAILPRRNLLSRHAAGRSRKEQILMANLDRLVLLMSMREPEFSPYLLDRFLVAAEHRGLGALICLNKVDLASPQEAESLLAPYRAAGYEGLVLCAREGRGLHALRAALRDRVSLLLGPSGTGKSTLLAALQPQLDLSTRSVSRASGLGRHTTTRTELHGLDFGGFLADSPGLREFGLWGLDPRALADCFPEFRPYLGACHYPDCSHAHEPGCAVLDALASGALSASRHASYIQILEEVEAAT